MGIDRLIKNVILRRSRRICFATTDIQILRYAQDDKLQCHREEGAKPDAAIRTDVVTLIGYNLSAGFIVISPFCRLFGCPRSLRSLGMTLLKAGIYEPMLTLIPDYDVLTFHFLPFPLKK